MTSRNVTTTHSQTFCPRSYFRTAVGTLIYFFLVVSLFELCFEKTCHEIYSKKAKELCKSESFSKCMPHDLLKSLSIIKKKKPNNNEKEENFLSRTRASFFSHPYSKTSKCCFRKCNCIQVIKLHGIIPRNRASIKSKRERRFQGYGMIRVSLLFRTLLRCDNYFYVFHEITINSCQIKKQRAVFLFDNI